MTSHQRRRRGFTLVECLMACAMAVVILSIVTAVVKQFLHSSIASTEHLERTANLARLAEMLRRDAHMATSLQVDEAEDCSSRLRLELPNGRQVAYSLAPERVSCTVLNKEHAEAPEDFRLHGMQVIEWQHTPSEIALVLGFVAHPGAEEQALRSKFRVVASLPTGNDAVEVPTP